jgi:hypothetical protein
MSVNHRVGEDQEVGPVVTQAFVAAVKQQEYLQKQNNDLLKIVRKLQERIALLEKENVELKTKIEK